MVWNVASNARLEDWIRRRSSSTTIGVGTVSTMAVRRLRAVRSAVAAVLKAGDKVEHVGPQDRSDP